MKPPGVIKSIEAQKVKVGAYLMWDGRWWLVEDVVGSVETTLIMSPYEISPSDDEQLKSFEALDGKMVKVCELNFEHKERLQVIPWKP